MDLFSDLTLVLVAALVGGFIAHRARQPLIVGYLVAGVVVGPFTGGLTVRRPQDIEEFAEIGVVLLLFSLGLEVSFRELARVRAVAIVGGLIQVALTIAVGIVLAMELGWSALTATWFGGAVALSSTMVALKTLQAQGRIGTLSSRVMLGILIVQDMAVVPLMIVLPALATGEGGWLPVAAATLRALAVVAGVVIVSMFVVPRILSGVARANSRELFLLTTTAVALGIALAAWRLGLSLALGAFTAGLVINESDYAHQALSDLIPLRDVFGMLFFVSAGMLVDPVIAWQHIGTLAIVVGALVVAKGLILAGIVAAFGYRRIVPLATGLTLFQVGEFSFVLARAGRAAGALPDDGYALVLNAAIVTMALTPLLSGLAPRIYAWRRRSADEAPLAANVPALGLSGHVVIAGAGRVGETIAGALAELGVSFVLIEYDARRFERLRQAGVPIVYGDASRVPVLEAASVHGARAVVITVPVFAEVRSILRVVRSLGPDLPVIARADGREAVRALAELGLEDVASPEFEAAIEMTRLALARLGVRADTVMRTEASIRARRYRSPGAD